MSQCNYHAVQILPNHHARLAQVVADHGPRVDGQYLFPAYLFISEKPPSYFWGYTGVIRCLKSEVAPDELGRAVMAYRSIRHADIKDRRLGMLKSAVISIRSVDGTCIATIDLFGRSLRVKVA